MIKKGEGDRNVIEEQEEDKKRKMPPVENIRHSIFISNIPVRLLGAEVELKDQIRTLFSSYGTIVNVHLCRQKHLHGKGFVDFEVMEAVDAVCQAVEESGGSKFMLGDIPLHVERKSNRPAVADPGKKIAECTASQKATIGGDSSLPKQIHAETPAMVQSTGILFEACLYLRCRSLSTKAQLLHHFLPSRINSKDPIIGSEVIHIGRIEYIETSRKPYFLMELKQKRTSSSTVSVMTSAQWDVVLQAWMKAISHTPFHDNEVQVSQSNQSITEYREKLALKNVKEAQEAKATKKEDQSAVKMPLMTLIPRALRAAKK